MKKLFLLTLALASFSFANAQQFQLGGSLGYSTEINTIGFGADVVYSFSDKWGAAADIYLNPKKDGVKYTFYDVNAHYNFTGNFYALAGLNYLKSKIDDVNIQFGGFSFGLGAITNNSFTDTGLNLGIGNKWPISDGINLFSEAKYITTGKGLFNIRVGVLFNI